jgi:hypothetical protein
MHATLTANFDGEALRLDEPLQLPPNTKVHVMVWTDDDEFEQDRRGWSALGKRAMSRFYDGSEPEYSIADAIS